MTPRTDSWPRIPVMALLFLAPSPVASVSPPKRRNPTLAAMARNPSAYPSSTRDGRRLPVLLFDIMDTVVRDPFYEDVPTFFGMPMKELLEYKHPTSWMEFEKGLIDEMELAQRFFKDGRPIDLEGLKECMRKGYSYVDGIEDLLRNLKKSNYEMHAFTNYPIWYLMIEEKLKISTYLSWTFCSCSIGKRKPAAELYMEASQRLGVDPSSCLFIDDRMTNVEAAINAGMVGIHFKSAASLRRDLSLFGIQTNMVDTEI
uniref:Phosphoglycolate phosphatase n=1 Tax=Anthurium amnicola TaxID=1678845 RepID=A0A1D1Y1J1_9ARAE